MLELLPFLLAPVLALLFLNLRLSRKLRYPHDLLKAEGRSGMASFLFRNFRTYYDALLDGLLAVALAFALVPPPRHLPAAVVLDGSRAMLGGFGEARPIAKALQRLQTDPALRAAEPFALVFDAKVAGTRLVPIRAFLEGTDVEASIRRLREAFAFFAPDYARLAELCERGYGEITLLTDQRRVEPEGFHILELGFAVTFAAYPASVRYDSPSESWIVALAEAGPRVPLAVSAWNREERHFFRLPPDRYAIEEGTAGRIVRFPAPGLYLLSLKGPFGLEAIDLPLLLAPRALSAVASGPFSERMLSVFPDLERTALPAVALVDLGAKAPASQRRVLTALVPEDGEQVLDPAAAGGALLAVGATSGGAALVLGPSSLHNEDLVLAYDAVLARQEPPFLTAPATGGKRLLGTGSAYLAEGLLPLIAPPGQFFETGAVPRLVLPPPTAPRWPWALLLAGLAFLKLALWSRFTGKSMLARD